MKEYIGYWRRDRTADEIANRVIGKAFNYEDGNLLPWPEANSVENVAEQTEIVARLEHTMATEPMIQFKGMSMCRLCGIINGTTELQINHKGVAYYIPEGYVHYLKTHSVKADSRLLQILR